MPMTKKKTAAKKTAAVRKKRASKKQAAPKKVVAKKSPAKSVTTKQPSIQTLTLDAVLVINNAESLYQEFKQFTGTTDINIDASAVKMIDTAILQLLYAFVIKIKSSNHTVNWINPSEEFVSRATLLGLSQHIGIT